MSADLPSPAVSFMGMKVIVMHLPPVPRIQISPTFKWCTEEFRARENAEWLKMFGTKNVMYMSNDTILINEPDYMTLKRIAMATDFV